MKVIAHRGCIVDHPENTLEAMEAALIEGADGIEFDIHRSLDGVWYLIHDTTVDRTTDGEGSVKLLTSAQLDDLWISGGEGYRAQDHGTRYVLPRLLDVLDMADEHPDSILMFHVKPATQVAFTEIAQLIVSRMYLERAYFLADSRTYLPDVKAVDPDIRTVFASNYQSTVYLGVDAPLLPHTSVDKPADVAFYPEWDAYVPVGDNGELLSMARCYQWGVRNMVVNNLHDALSYTLSETYPMPDSIKVFPAGSIASGVTNSNTAGDAYLLSVSLPAMTVEGLAVRGKVANTGIVKWGLFDGATKVCGGSGTVLAGWTNLAADTPTGVSAGAYSLVIAQPASAAPTLAILDAGTGNLVWRALSYTWVDTLDPVAFGTPYAGPVTCFLFGA